MKVKSTSIVFVLELVGALALEMHPSFTFAPKCTQAKLPSGLYSFCCTMPKKKSAVGIPTADFLFITNRT